MHVTAFLKSPAKHKTGPVLVLSGAQRYLKQAALRAVYKLVLGTDEDEADPAGLTRFAGRDAELKSVRDELLTVSMWGDRRLVVVEDADEFVSKYRAALENYLANPAAKSVLLLDVKSWPKNTRLAKAVAKIGLDLECADLKGAALERWLGETSREKYDKQLGRDAASLMIQLAGTDLGLLDQELAKLAAYVGHHSRIEVQDVSTLVGGWKAETTWAMIDALLEGRPGVALACLDKLLIAGEAPLKILGGINFRFVQLAKATELARQGMPLTEALRQVGTFRENVAASARYLRRIGRPQAEKLYARLIAADGDLKGETRIPDRTRLEQLLVRLGGNP